MQDTSIGGDQESDLKPNKQTNKKDLAKGDGGGDTRHEKYSNSNKSGKFVFSTPGEERSWEPDLEVQL